MVQYSYVFQEEKSESGTAHLQGCFKHRNPIDFASVKKNMPRAHLEPCKNWNKSVLYCSKLETRSGSVYSNIDIDIIKDPMEGLKLKGWQHRILNTIKKVPDDRKIFWFYDKAGNTGKTTFCKSLVLKHKAFYCSGKANDIKHAICMMKIKPKIVLWDVPRSNLDYISYQAIEEVKNGIFFSGKYESGTVIYNIPHVIILCNEEPNYGKLSKDRWTVVNIEQTS
jgi:hypothetical protein